MAIPFASRSDASFITSLSFDYLNSLENHPQSVYGLRPDFSLAYMNPAWFNFAEQNAGPRVSSDWPIGRCILDAISENLREWYRSFFTAANADSGQHPKHHEYECSSPELFRVFVMTVYPIRQMPQGGLVVVNSLRFEVPNRQGARGATSRTRAAVYADEDGLLHQCMHCRRFRSMVDPTAWDWVSDWVRDPQTNVSHSLCPVCLEYYYAASDIETARDDKTV